MSQQCTSLLSPQLYALGLPPKRAAWVLLLWWSDLYGWSGRLYWTLVQLVGRSYLVWMLLAAV